MNLLYKTLFIIIISFSSQGAEKLLIEGGNDSYIGISFEEFDFVEEGQKLGYKSYRKKFKHRIKKQLEDTQIFKIYQSNNNIVSFLRGLSINNESFLEGSIKLKIEPTFESYVLKATVTLDSLIIKDSIWQKSFTFATREWEKTAAQISDEIYKTYTGLEGYIDSKIIFISETGKAINRKKTIATKDLYGDDYKFLSDGKELILSPKLSPNGEIMLFVLYKKDKATIYMHDIKSGKRKELLKLAKNKSAVKKIDGIIYAPNFSHNGKMITFAAAYEGNSEIMLFDLENLTLSRLSFNKAIDTSPAFSAKDNEIVFSSDRSGKQELYLIDLKGKNLRKIDFADARGNYTSPSFSPDGKYISFVRILRNKFSIGILNLKSFSSKILTTSYKDESPTWSKNSKFIMFARKYPLREKKKSGFSEILITNLNGQIITRVRTPKDASSPNWASP